MGAELKEDSRFLPCLCPVGHGSFYAHIPSDTALCLDCDAPLTVDTTKANPKPIKSLYGTTLPSGISLEGVFIP